MQQNNELNSDLMSSYSSSRPGEARRKLKKRRFKEIDNAWNLEAGAQGMIATRR